MITSRLGLLSVIGALAMPASVDAQADADDPVIRLFPVVVADHRERFSSADCGLYCFFTNAKCYGEDVDLSTLFSGKYMNGSFGSSMEDLLRCSRDFRFHAESFGNLSILDLWLLERPVIALVKNSLDSKSYNHWVLVTGVEGGHVALFDPSAPQSPIRVEKIPLRDFLCVWGGVACVIIPELNDVIVYKLARFTAIAIKVFALFGLTLLFQCGQTICRERLRWVIIPAFAIGLATVYHFVLPIGFFRSSEHVHVLTTPPRQAVTHIQVHDWMARVTEREEYLVIDVRYRDTFRLNHIPGAVNIPVTASDVAFLAYLQSATKDTPILIYCQSSSCPWAATTARRRVFDAFDRVAVLEGGMEAYLEIMDAHEKDRK